jgi:SHS2 domain-containing protein
LSPARRAARRPGRARWRLLPHTADIAVGLGAPTLRGLFDAAAEALLHLASGGPPGVTGRRRQSLVVRGVTLEDLLVRWLQEILFRQETRGWRFGAARVTRLDRKRLRIRGVATGEPYDPARHRRGREIKAVTYHRLAIRRRNGRYLARLVLDV